MKIKKIILGRKYRDTITGIEGVAIGTTLWLTGCQTVGLERVVKDESKIEWVDDMRVTLLNEEPVIEEKEVATGGPNDAAPTPNRH